MLESTALTILGRGAGNLPLSTRTSNTGYQVLQNDVGTLCVPLVIIPIQPVIIIPIQPVIIIPIQPVIIIPIQPVIMFVKLTFI